MHPEERPSYASTSGLEVHTKICRCTQNPILTFDSHERAWAIGVSPPLTKTKRCGVGQESPTTTPRNQYAVPTARYSSHKYLCYQPRGLTTPSVIINSSCSVFCGGGCHHAVFLLGVCFNPKNPQLPRLWLRWQRLGVSGALLLSIGRLSSAAKPAVCQRFINGCPSLGLWFQTD